jgi:uncharacterized membrane protein
MKKLSNIVPFLLLGIYFLFINSNQNLDFTIKTLVLIIFLVISLIVVYKKYKEKGISKYSLIAFVISFLLTMAGFFYYYF